MARIVLYRGLKGPQHIPDTTREQFADAQLSLRIAQREREVEARKLKSRARQAVMRTVQQFGPGVTQLAERVVPDPNTHARNRLNHASANPHAIPAQQFSDSLEIALKYAGEDGYVVSVSPEYAEVEEYDWGTNHEAVQTSRGEYISLPYSLYEIPVWLLNEKQELWHMREQSVKEIRELHDESRYESRGEGRMSMR